MNCDIKDLYKITIPITFNMINGRIIERTPLIELFINIHSKKIYQKVN